MKIAKWFLIAASALVFCGACDDDENIDPAPVPDRISINPNKSTIGSKGGDASVLVTSTGEWTLTGDDNDFVIPSAMKGKDGDIVKFTVKANDREEDQTFNYTFACGSEKASYTLVLKKKASQVEEEFDITFAPESNILPREGGSVSVLVTSSNDWTLEGSSSFVHPSATSGNDGDEVIFVVDANETVEDMFADYSFKMGDKNIPFRITLKGGAIIEYTVEIVGQKELVMSYLEHKRIVVTLNTNVPYRDLVTEISSIEAGWLTKEMTVQGSGETEVVMYFTLAQNDGFTARDASIKISGPTGGEAILKIKQLPLSVIEVENLFYDLGTTGATVEVPVKTNVDYDVTLSQTAEGWFACDDADQANLKFTYQDLPEGVMRSCTATLTEKNPVEGMQPKVVVLEFAQKVKGVISMVVDMTKAHAWPAWTDPMPVTDMTAFTLEALVNPTDLKYEGATSTIMGIEDVFLIRMGTPNIAENQIEVSWKNGSFTNKNMLLNANEWAHIAVTFGEGTVKVFINGEEKGSSTSSVPSKVNFGVAHASDKYDPNSFWIGYSFMKSKSFNGMMSEVRIWNRVLTTDELGNEARRYVVEPQSDGLVAYWKFNEGDGTVIKDYTSYGNDLTAANINWAPVSLP